MTLIAMPATRWSSLITLGILKPITLGDFFIWSFIDWFLIIGAARRTNVAIATPDRRRWDDGGDGEAKCAERSAAGERNGRDGGRDRDRTCDPLHVKEVLFR
jgi:hypothetical protein